MNAKLSETDQFQSQVIDYLQTRMPEASALSLHNVQRIAVGWSHETWLFDLQYTEKGAARQLGLCLRRDPGNALLQHLSDLGQQFRVLQCLEKTGVPSPKPYWYESDPAILGAPFLVMEKVAGECPSPWGREGLAYYKAAAARGSLPKSFTQALISIHTVDWRAAGLDFLGVPGPGKDFARREIAKWRELINLSGHGPEPMMTDLLCWLENNIPPTDRLTLVHGAYRTGNLLIHEDRISAVLDWELQVIGDPMYDVAYVLTALNREGTPLLSNLVDRDDFFRDYESATGIKIDEDACRYYYVLYAMRTAAFWMSASGLYASGRSNDLRLARTAWALPVVLSNAARDLGY